MDKNERPLTLREIVNEISEKTEIKSDIVKSIIDCFIDIFIRETVLKGMFHLKNCFTVDKTKKSARKGYNIKLQQTVEYPETEVLRIKLSRKIRYYWRWKLRNERNNKNNTTKENWHDFYENEK